MKRAIWIFVAGLAWRLIAIAYLARVRPSMLAWGVNEAGGIARWIVTTHSYSSPFHDAYGPTAWLAPIYPLLVAGAFLAFGVQTSESAIAMVLFNAVCSAATGIVVYKIGKEVGGEKAGSFAGWLWALSPYIAILPYILWDTSLSALVFGTALWQTLKLRSGSSDAWAGCGVTWGIAALVNPALLAPLPILVWWLIEGGKKWKPVAILTLCTVALMVPWTIRNYIAFHEILPMRSNGLAEVYFANAGFYTHPLGPSMEYQHMGEGAFTAEGNHRALKLVENAPLNFLRNSLKRAPWFWMNPPSFWPVSVAIDISALAGLVVTFRKFRMFSLPLLAPLAVYPLIYYASQVVSRYRHPIDPVLYALSGIALSSISLRQR